MGNLVLTPHGSSIVTPCRKGIQSASPQPCRLRVVDRAENFGHKQNACRQRAASGPMRLRRRHGCPVRRCLSSSAGLVVVVLCVWRCSAVCARSRFSASWRCCFAVWLRLPGEAVADCSPSCPLRPFCSGGRSSLVPGFSASAGCWVPSRFPLVAERRRVASRWLARAGWSPGFGLLLGDSLALPFPSVLSAAWRGGVSFSSLWSRCLAARCAWRRRR